MGKKLTIGIISTIAGLSVAGGVCYNTIPSFKTTINDIFKNNNNKANIGFDKPSDDNTDSAIKPIEPSEFLKTYKYELPTSFLGGQLYVKALSNNNLLVSSSVTTSILICNAETAEVTTALLSHSNWQYFYELDNGNCLISSTDNGSGLALYNTDTNTIEQIYDNYQSFSRIEKSPTGDYVLISLNNALVRYNSETNNCQILATSNYLYNFIVLTNGDCLYCNASTNPGIWRVNYDGSENYQVHTSGNSWNFSLLSNNSILISSSLLAYPGLYLYEQENDTIIQLLDTGYQYYKYCYQLNDDTYIISYSSTPGGAYLLTLSDNTITKVIDKGGMYNKFVKIKNGDHLIYYNNSSGSYYPLLLYKAEDNTIEILSESIKGYIYTYELINGDILLTCKYVSSMNSGQQISGVYLYSMKNMTLTKIYSTGQYWDIFCELSNGNCLIGSTSSNYLLLYNSIDCTVKQLLNKVTVSSITEQEDGTYLIKTNDFDYEYDCVSDTIKLVYTVTE